MEDLIGSNAHEQLVAYIACSVVVVVGVVVIVSFFVKEKCRMRGIECQDMETIAEHYDSEQIIE